MDYNLDSFITKDLINNKKKVRFMYREKPDKETDSGWRFFSGNESQEYVDNADNIVMEKLDYVVKEIDPSIQKYLNSEIGSVFERENSDEDFKEVKDYNFGKDLN